MKLNVKYSVSDSGRQRITDAVYVAILLLANLKICVGNITLSSLGKDLLGWFQRDVRGVYDLNAKGKAALVEYAGLAEKFKLE